MMHQTYLKDCDCKMEGIILFNGKAVCRWCRKPYTEGGSMGYVDEHFEQPKEYEILQYGYAQNNENKPDQQYIHSVKRLSDSEVFSINEITEQGKIIEFGYSKESGLHVYIPSKNCNYPYPYKISEISKVKQPIPLLSFEDIESCTQRINFNGFKIGFLDEEKLKEISKSKM